MAVSVGIDLGTTYSVVAIIDKETNQPRIVPNSEGNKITPSVIQFVEGSMVFGTEAENAFNSGEPDCVATFKRSMGKQENYCIIDGKPYTPVDLSALLLKHLKEDAEAELGESIVNAVITVPAYFYSTEREATVQAAEKAGIKVKKIIDEPNAAVMAYGLNHWRENANILVYDLGGGTFDVTLSHMNGNGDLQTIVTRGDHFLGGRDWDDRLENILRDKFENETGGDFFEDEEAIRTIRGLTEGVKKQLTSMQCVTVKTSFADYGYTSVTISRNEFEKQTADLIERTGVLCRAILEEAGLKWSDITDILLVGGSTRMPQVSSYLMRLYGKRPITHVNPDEAVALGAAIQSAKENSKYTQLSVSVVNGKKETDRKTAKSNMHLSVRPSKKLESVGVISLRETTAHAMGMIAVNREGTRYINDVIIPANHPRPVKAAKAFSFQTRKRGNNEMEIFVLQGDKENPLDNLIPFRYVVTGLKYTTETKGKTTVKVQYSYDDNGIINVEARQDGSNDNLPIKRECVPEDMIKYGLPINPEDLKPEPLNVVMALDVSGSMSGTPMEDAKQAMCKFLDDLDFAYTSVAIMAVSDRTATICGLTDSKEQCIRGINSIECGATGYGNSTHPFYEIKKILENADGRLFAIILADGVWSNPWNAVEAARECNDSGIETAAIGFGGADYNFLKSISSEDANAIFVSQLELGSAFGSIAQSLGTSVQNSNETLGVMDINTWGN